MTKEKLIKEYSEKIDKCDRSINKMFDMLKMYRRGQAQHLDIEDLNIELSNCKRDRQLYLQFTKDLEDL